MDFTNFYATERDLSRVDDTTSASGQTVLKPIVLNRKDNVIQIPPTMPRGSAASLSKKDDNKLDPANSREKQKVSASRDDSNNRTCAKAVDLDDLTESQKIERR